MSTLTRGLLLSGTLILLFCATLAAGQDPTIVSFDAPGVVCPSGSIQCTVPVAINGSGDVTGYYTDVNTSFHAFARSRNGTFLTFDIFGSNCSLASGNGVCTQPAGITEHGDIAGFFCNANTCHGFLRHPDGDITRFDPPGSVVTQVNGINNDRVIIGYYFDANFTQHGFLRGRHGAITSFDATGEVNGTIPTAISSSGVIAGYYLDGNFAEHGFVRSIGGSFSTFDPAGSIFTQANAINTAGTVVGFYYDSSETQHGFVRDADGTITTFDVPGAQGTALVGINAAGMITGVYTLAGEVHGFVQTADGTFTPFDPPGSTATLAMSMNFTGAITGWYRDEQGVNHGFLRFSGE